MKQSKKLTLLGLSDPEEEGTAFLRNFGNYLTVFYYYVPPQNL
jgi:hypothetical protein